MTLEIRPSTSFMFLHLNDMFENKQTLTSNYTRKFIFLNTLVGIYLKFRTNLGFDSTMCTICSNVCKQ